MDEDWHDSAGESDYFFVVVYVLSMAISMDARRPGSHRAYNTKQRMIQRLNKGLTSLLCASIYEVES